MLWIPFTLMAGLMQAWRNALQKQLRNHVSTPGVTLSRFIVALPLASLYLWALYKYYPQTSIPTFTGKFFVCVMVAAITQIAATAFMVMLFQSRNYAVGVGLAKSEAVIAAALGALFFAAPLSLIAWCGVLIGAMATWFMSLGHPDNDTNKTLDTATSQPTSQSINHSMGKVTDKVISVNPRQTMGLRSKTMIIGLMSGLCFALCTLFIRQSALLLKAQGHHFLFSSAWVLLFVLVIQTLLLSVWLAWREPTTLTKLYQHKMLTTAVGIFGFMGSVGWFTAMSLQTVALVKTLGQIEVVFTLLISLFWFKEKLGHYDYWGLICIVIGAILVVLA